MTGLDKDARAFLDAAVQSDRPGLEDRVRIRAMIAAQVAAPSPPSSSPTDGVTDSVMGATGTSAYLKVTMVALVVLGAAAIGARQRVVKPLELPLPPTPVEILGPAVVDHRPATPEAEPAIARANAAVLGTAPSKKPIVRALAKNDAPLLELELEARMIGEARIALREGRPARALELADAHARRFPAGALVAERLGARALALCALGRRSDARIARTTLAARPDGSPLLTRIDEACRVWNASDE